MHLSDENTSWPVDDNEPYVPMPREEAYSRIGPGWKDFIDQIYDAVELISAGQQSLYPGSHKIEIHSVDSRWGMTDFKWEHGVDVSNWLISRVWNSVRAFSTTKCEICGKNGKRRRYFSWTPTLCRKHFIEHANYADERRKYYIENNLPDIYVKRKGYLDPRK